MEKIKNTKKAKIGIYTMGLQCYWAQFDGLWAVILWQIYCIQGRSHGGIRLLLWSG